MTSQSGERFSTAELDGKIWVADFFFTHCNGPCPRMSALMRRVQNGLPDASGVQLVSFTVDPARDTPEVLASYAQRQGARTGTWHFLTGELPQINDLSFNAFKLGTVDESLNHSTRFVLVDRNRRIRAYYRTLDGDPVPKVLSDIRRLTKEKF